MYRGNEQLLMNGHNLLYHFTTAEALFKILKQMRIRLSTFDNLNDLNEVDMCCKSTDGGFDLIKLREYIKTKGRLISFSQKRKPTYRSTINLPRMWAQYANNCDGVCIVINKQAFEAENKNALNGKRYSFSKVKYKNKLKQCEIKPQDNVEDFAWNNKKTLLCQKNTDWSGENEFRFLYFDSDLKPDDTVYLSIANSLEYICLGRRFVEDEKMIKTFVEMANNPSNGCFGKINSHDLAQAISSPYGYSSVKLHLTALFNGKYDMKSCK